jgi:hypothetical protein
MPAARRLFFLCISVSSFLMGGKNDRGGLAPDRGGDGAYSLVRACFLGYTEPLFGSFKGVRLRI